MKLMPVYIINGHAHCASCNVNLETKLLRPPKLSPNGWKPGKVLYSHNSLNDKEQDYSCGYFGVKFVADVPVAEFPIDED